MGLSFSFGSGKSKSSTSASSNTVVTAMDAASKKQLDDLTGLLLGTVSGGPSGAYSKDAALKDVSGVVENIFSRFQSDTMPKLFDAAGSAGVFNSTALQRMANEAYGRAVGEASAVTMDAVKSYAGISQQQEATKLSALLEALGLQAGAFKTESSTGSSFTRASGSSLSLGGAAK